MVKAGQPRPREGDARRGGIEGTQTLEELYGVLRGMQAYNRGLQDRGDYALVGSDGKRWTAEMVIAEIEKAKGGNPSQLTRTGGLRDKVRLLLAEEVHARKERVGDKTEFYREWRGSLEIFARNKGWNSSAHVDTALMILGQRAEFKRILVTPDLIKAAFEEADLMIKKSSSPK